jgi:hypothetical protein
MMLEAQRSRCDGLSLKGSDHGEQELCFGDRGGAAAVVRVRIGVLTLPTTGALVAATPVLAGRASRTQAAGAAPGNPSLVARAVCVGTKRED